MKVGACDSSAQNPPIAPHLTQSKNLSLKYLQRIFDDQAPHSSSEPHLLLLFPLSPPYSRLFVFLLANHTNSPLMIFGLAFPSAYNSLLAQIFALFAPSPLSSLLSNATFSVRTSLMIEYKIEATSTYCLACSVSLPCFIFIHNNNHHWTNPSSQVKNTFYLHIVDHLSLPSIM